MWLRLVEGEGDDGERRGGSEEGSADVVRVRYEGDERGIERKMGVPGNDVPGEERSTLWQKAFSLFPLFLRQKLVKR